MKLLFENIYRILPTKRKPAPDRVGITALRRCVAVAAAMLLFACAESNPEAERAAFEATKPWLALMDAADYQRCWEIAAPLFRDNEEHEAWLAKAHGYREPLGAFQSRQLKTATYIPDPWFAPSGEYAVVVYDSHWQAGTIYEILHMQRLPDGDWLVAGYNVQEQ